MKTICIILLSFTLTVLAQSLPDTTQSEPTDTTATHPNVSDKDKRLFIEKIEIKGELEKPQAVFFLPGQTPEIDDIKIERSFFNDIFRPVQKQSVVETKYIEPESFNRRDVIKW